MLKQFDLIRWVITTQLSIQTHCTLVKLLQVLWKRKVLNFLIWWNTNLELLTHFETTEFDKNPVHAHLMFLYIFWFYIDLSLHKSWDVVFILAVAGDIKCKGFWKGAVTFMIFLLYVTNNLTSFLNSTY